MFSAAQLRVILRALVSIDPYPPFPVSHLCHTSKRESDNLTRIPGRDNLERAHFIVDCIAIPKVDSLLPEQTI
jgi:hypothetical protein